jgi:hypothetical protein
VVRQAEADIGMTRQEYADDVFRTAIIGGFPEYSHGIDCSTPDGRLAAARFLHGAMLLAELYGGDAIWTNEGNSENIVRMRDFPEEFALHP